MLVKDAKAIARRWVIEHASATDGFYGAFYAGSANWLPAEAILPATSDVDVWIVWEGPGPGDKPGKFLYQDVLLEVSYQSSDQLRSPEVVLADYHQAGSFRTPNIIVDPSGQLSLLQAAVAQDYAKRHWVRQRCEQARDKVLRNIQSINPADPLHDQVMAWLFGAGVTTHVLLVAGMRNPTVRRRYVAVRELLKEYDQSDVYETLLAMLGCQQMSQAQATQHLAALAEVFDATKAVVKTPFFFAADISDLARPVAIDGSRELIEQGLHREAIFWMLATHCRCQKVLAADAPVELQERFLPSYRALLADLGITSPVDLQQRSEQVKALLPNIWQVAEAIMAANPAIEE